VGQPGYHGTAILSRFPWEGVLPCCDFNGTGEARHTAVRWREGWVLHNIYIPAGGDIPDGTINIKFQQKADYLSGLLDWSQRLPATLPVLLVGDFNIAPWPLDVWSHQALLKVVSHTPVEVGWLEALRASASWHDIHRYFVPPTERLYSWWSYRSRDWLASDRGRRLDHAWCTPAFWPWVVGMEGLRSARGWDEPSDHIPLWVDFHLSG
jgi:exodeoxyribonuclease-3